MAPQDAMGLTEFAAETVRPQGPFCAKTTLIKPSHFPSPFDQTDPDRYRFVTRVKGEIIGVDACMVEHGAVGLRLYRADRGCDLDVGAVKAEIRRRLGFEMDLSGYEAIWMRDEILRRLPNEMMGARPSSPFSLYEFLVICVLLQNTTVGRTVAMANALSEDLGQEVVFPDGMALRSFWTPPQLVRTGEERLRVLKLGYRARILDRISRQFTEEAEMETRLMEIHAHDNLLRQRLMSLYGVGPASIGYLLFEWFKKIDRLDHISPWELKILSKLLFESECVAARDMIMFCRERWAPFTMLAVHAIFESVFWRRLNGNGPEWLDGLIRL
ncbi:hypothetical protein [Accumulibacter sp.]|uniref:hypothetical protein n=1 Tax=Accumulibacter sp. TaxID=2053492 RepID=UPI0035B332D3